MSMGDEADALIDAMWDDYGTEWEGEGSHSVTCRYCKTRGLEWGKVKGSWVLMDDAGEPHTCPNRAQPAASVDEFDAL